MRRDRREAQAAYDRLCEVLRREHEGGRNAVVAVEGDVSIYASIHYVLDRLLTAGIPVEQVPGIPSFIAAASAASLSLVSQHERLLVVPGDVDADELSRLLAHGHVVVVMKLSACEEAVKAYIQRNKAVECHYFENVGTSKAFDTGDSDAILKRRFPYFSLLMLRARRPVS
jgi:precorrin-2/cobalt-factor-2 C20-methyltransferase